MTVVGVVTVMISPSPGTVRVVVFPSPGIVTVTTAGWTAEGVTVIVTTG
jgi:hypothetical protein